MSPASVAAMGARDGRRAFFRTGEHVAPQVAAWTDLRDRRHWLPEAWEQRLYMHGFEAGWRRARDGRLARRRGEDPR